MTNKERIIELSKHFNTKEVAEICNVSVSYVCRVLRQHNPKTLTLLNYLNAIEKGTTAKSELANLFGVCYRTLLRFEQKYMTKENLGQMLYIEKGNLEELKTTFNLTNQESAKLSTLPTLPGVMDELKQMIKALEKYKNATPRHAELYRKILTALNNLNC
ncbi:MAG: hypothetical protein K2L76_03925 [Muribaculaceae bacterium]|nr:hypothetical protein [Muribaculaceae bacterium]